MITFHQVVSSDAITVQALATILFGAISVYAATRCVYLLYFHPLSKFPGPRIAAISNIWYAYHWLSGRYPWAIENVLKKYGDVVRIAPNELVFITPQAFNDIYSSSQKNLETFVKTDFNDRGKDLGGLIWEEDPVRHRAVAKKVSPAFSNRSLTAMLPLIHEHTNYFVERMKELGGAPDGVELSLWTSWLAMDMSVDLAWNGKMHQMRDMKSSVYLDVLLGFNAFTTVIQVFKRFPLLSPIKFLLAPLSQLSSLAAMAKSTRVEIERRIENRHRTEHVDFFEHLLPADSPAPTNRREETHLGSIALQLMFAGFGNISDWFYSILYFLLQEPEYQKLLIQEIRNAFKNYDDINLEALTTLPYLHACLEESLRVLPGNNTGLARISPGAIVDGQYVPKGAFVQTSVFALSRSPHYFHEPLRFRPQRWLPSDHPLYDAKFAKDNLKGFLPFSIGPRSCTGRKMAWMEGRLLVAKTLWMFDVIEVPGQNANLEEVLRHYGFLIKPELKVRFIPVSR